MPRIFLENSSTDSEDELTFEVGRHKQHRVGKARKVTTVSKRYEASLVQDTAAAAIKIHLNEI